MRGEPGEVLLALPGPGEVLLLTWRGPGELGWATLNFIYIEHSTL